MNILLVQPEFPVSSKSKNHCSFFPVGLLKIGAYHRSLGDEVQLLRGLHYARFDPEEIKITSLFTYWAAQVHRTARFYHMIYPRAKIEIGGIYATLMPDDCKQRLPFAEVCQGLYRGGVAEAHRPDYGLLPDNVDFQIVHASRGCPRKCPYCAVWKIEPTSFESSISGRILRRKLIFYDNNLLVNPNIESILRELAEWRDEKRQGVWCECQSGLDRRVLNEKPHLASLLRKAHFHNPRIAWDGRYAEWKAVKQSIKILRRAGYPAINIYVFMLYNYEIPYQEMRRKLEACRRWGVRVADCRFRPLNRTDDGYKPYLKKQESGAYHVQDGWTDRQVRAFRRAVRRQNIAVMLGLPNNRYIEGCERRHVAV